MKSGDSEQVRRYHLALPCVLLTILIDFLGLSILIPVLPIYAKTLGASRTEIGILFAVYALAQLFFIPAWGALSDRIGRRPVILISLVGIFCAFSFLAASDTLLCLVLARLLGGLFAANISTAQAIITDLTSPEMRSKAMGWVGATIGLAFVIGPALGGILATLHENNPQLEASFPLLVNAKLPFLFVAFLAGANFLFTFFFLKESHTQRAQTFDVKFLLRRILLPSPVRLALGRYPAQIKVFLTLFLILHSSLGAMEAMFTPYLNGRFGMNERHVGMTLAYIGVCMIVVQGGLLGRITRRFSEVKIVAIGLFVFAFSLLGIALAPSTRWLFGLGPVLALGQGIAYPVFLSLYSKTCFATKTGEMLGDSYSMQTTGRILGPLLGGLAVDYIDLRAPFLIGSILVTGCALWIYHHLARTITPAT